MKTPFTETSYLSQVRRLRKHAEIAAKQFGIKTKKTEFINHGENSTFKIIAKDNAKYLLRIHRNGYHSKEAIQEELNWLDHLARKKFLVPLPVRSKAKKLVEQVSSEGVGTRNVSMFHWREARFADKKLKPSHLFEVGKLMAQLQLNTPNSKVKHRKYWTADGLLGTKPKFGAMDEIQGATPKQQKLITDSRKQVLRRLKTYERKFPKRQGLIHADLHFGNILFCNGTVAAIDFDDCGFGFHAYDVAVTLIGTMFYIEKEMHRFPEYKKALLDGYQTLKPWDKHDEAILTDLIVARRLTMLGWLNSRTDNPRLKKILKKRLSFVLKLIKDRK